MLDKPHDVRLHSWRASHGSYNLKDPPGSPTLKYPGPQWVPDNLRAAWCAAETLTHCLSRDASLTYKSAHWMLDSVLPDQCEHCEIGIELMLMDGHFTPEQAPCTRSYTDSSPLTPESMGLRKSLRRGSGSRAPCLQDNMLDKILVVIRKWWLNMRNGVMSLSIHHATSENSLLRPFWLEHLWKEALWQTLSLWNELSWLRRVLLCAEVLDYPRNHLSEREMSAQRSERVQLSTHLCQM